MTNSKQRKVKKSKARKAAKRDQRKTTYDPNVKSKYAQKKIKQAKGIYSPNSPFKVVGLES